MRARAAGGAVALTPAADAGHARLVIMVLPVAARRAAATRSNGRECFGFTYIYLSGHH